MAWAVLSLQGCAIHGRYIFGETSMSWAATASVVTQYPKEQPGLERLVEDHPARAAFELAGFSHPSLNGSLMRDAMKEILGRAYGDVFPSQVREVQGAVKHSSTENPEPVQRALRFLAVCAAQDLGIDMG
jgi:hypothetical protein